MNPTKTQPPEKMPRKIKPQDLKDLEQAIQYLQKTSKLGMRWQDLLGRPDEANY